MKKRKPILMIENEEEKPGKEILIEKGLSNTDPGKNIKMPKRKSREEYADNDPFKRKYISLTKEEDYQYHISLALKMKERFGYRNWMVPYIDEQGNPKNYSLLKKIKHRKPI